jgi:uncharacterized protein (TIGR03067 family)
MPDEEVVKGEWQLVGWEDNRKKAPEGLLKELPDVRIKGGELTICGRDENRKETRERARLTLDPAKSPKEITLTVLDGPRKGTALAGIYVVKDGKWHICVNHDGGVRPKEFVTRPNDNCWLLTFEPVAKKP